MSCDGHAALCWRTPTQPTELCMITVLSEKVLAGFLGLIVLALVLLQWLPLVNGIGLIGVTGLAWFFRREKLQRWANVALFVVLVPLVFWVATYRPEGFSYPLLFSLSAAPGETLAHEFYLNFSKALAGFVLLYLLWPKLRNGEFVVRARYSLAVVVIASVLVIALAVQVLGLTWQPKSIEQVLLFAMANLFIICVAEEAFMRFLFQQNLRNAVASLTANRALQEIIPLLLVTVIFVAIHAGISGAAVWVYALAGFLYGLSYTLGKNILYPIAIHFLVNQIHFSFLTYPL